MFTIDLFENKIINGEEGISTTDAGYELAAIEEVSGELDRTVIEAGVLNNAIESLATAMNFATAGKEDIANGVYTATMVMLGGADTTDVGTEGLTVGTEGIKDTLKKAWAKAKEFAKKIYEYVKKLIMKAIKWIKELFKGKSSSGGGGGSAEKASEEVNEVVEKLLPAVIEEFDTIIIKAYGIKADSKNIGDITSGLIDTTEILAQYVKYMKHLGLLAAVETMPNAAEIIDKVLTGYEKAYKDFTSSFSKHFAIVEHKGFNLCILNGVKSYVILDEIVAFLEAQNVKKVDTEGVEAYYLIDFEISEETAKDITIITIEPKAYPFFSIDANIVKEQFNKALLESKNNGLPGGAAGSLNGPTGGNGGLPGGTPPLLNGPTGGNGGGGNVLRLPFHRPMSVPNTADMIKKYREEQTKKNEILLLSSKIIDNLDTDNEKESIKNSEVIDTEVEEVKKLENSNAISPQHSVIILSTAGEVVKSELKTKSTVQKRKGNVKKEVNKVLTGISKKVKDTNDAKVLKELKDKVEAMLDKPENLKKAGWDNTTIKRARRIYEEISKKL